MQFLDWDFSQDLSTAVHVVTGEETRFTRTERSLLQAFLSYKGRVCTRDSLLDAVVGVHAAVSDRNIDYMISRLRRKLGDSARRPRYIESRYGEGYIWIADPALLSPVSHAALSPVRMRLRGAAIMSYCDRPDQERSILHRHADRVLVMRLQGFLYYIAANRVLDEVRQANRSGIDDLILDFRDVQGVDETAVEPFREMGQVARAAGTTLMFSGVRPVIENRFATLPIRRFGALDAALEWRETRILAVEPARAPAEQPFASLLAVEVGETDAAAIVSRLDHIEVPAGTVLVRSGEHTRDMFFVEQGTAEVMLDIDGTLMRASRIWPGALFGEIGFHFGGPRTATVRVLDECRLVRLTHAAVGRLEGEAPRLAVVLHRFLAACAARRLIFYNDMVVDFLRSTR